VAAVIAGSSVGLLLKTRLPEKITAIVFQGIGLVTIFFGMAMALRSQNWVVLILSIVSGAIVGQVLDLDERMHRAGERLKKLLKISNKRFTEGMVTAFLLFCMGSLTVLGALEEGMNQNPELILAKSVMDGFSSIALAAAMGIGVMFSVVPLLLYQGGITLFAGSLQNVLSEPMILEITAAGGIILLGMGINILEIKKIQVLNLLPALVMAVVFYYLINFF
ncbi:MAG TPA: DUF554 domain-containing protein, partial [Bacteroidales bacterium]|nr:DUF554 domain-containing protein [Bacteroidales bacterium]